MIPITLYTFYKRENSTKRPDSSVTQKTHNAVFKMPTSLQRPEITFPHWETDTILLETGQFPKDIYGLPIWK